MRAGFPCSSLTWSLTPVPETKHETASSGRGGNRTHRPLSRPPVFQTGTSHQSSSPFHVHKRGRQESNLHIACKLVDDASRKRRVRERDDIECRLFRPLRLPKRYFPRVSPVREKRKVRGSNPQDLSVRSLSRRVPSPAIGLTFQVRSGGVEPPCLSAQRPQRCVYTSSTTIA